MEYWFGDVMLGELLIMKLGVCFIVFVFMNFFKFVSSIVLKFLLFDFEWRLV